MDTDIQAVDARVYLLPVTTRVPLKFGAEALTSVTCVRVSLQVQDATGRRAVGWGETPLSVQWAWPGELRYQERHDLMRDLCLLIAADWSDAGFSGHPLEVGHAFLQERLPDLVERMNRRRDSLAHMPRTSKFARPFLSLFLSGNCRFGRMRAAGGRWRHVQSD